MSNLVFNVPRELRRGGKQEVEAESVAEGVDLIQLMCKNLNIADLADSSVLDMGCGVKLVQAILDRNLPIGRYVGVDVFPDLIEFLQSNVTDDRFSFHLLNTHNEMYNPDGEPLSANTVLPLDEESFDIICLYSVFTHLAPHDFVAMLELLRRYISPEGRIMFSLFVHETTAGGHGFIDRVTDVWGTNQTNLEEYRQEFVEAAKHAPPDFLDYDPNRPLKWALYSRENALQLIKNTGWEVESLNDPEECIQHYMICKPV